MSKISLEFLNELFLLCFYKKDVVEVVSQHLKYQFIPDEYSQYKKVLRSIVTIYKNEDKLPTFGIVSQQHQQDLKVQETVTKIKETKFPDKEIILNELESFLKRSQFLSLNNKLATLYEQGKEEDAILLQAKESEQIVNFSIKQAGLYYSRVFQDFDKRMEQRLVKQESGEYKKDKVPFGIEPLDIITHGGIDVTDTVLWILRSGVGKSTALKWVGVNAARKHRNVLHIQLEGSQEECETKYDQVWTATYYNDIRYGNIDDKKYDKLQQIVNYMKSHNNDIFIHAFEQFNTASMVDVRNLFTDIEKKQGHIDLVIIDYLKYLDPGDGLKYGVDTQSVKMRKENTSDRIKNMAKEFGTRIMIADQASDVPIDIWNDPNKVLTRHNIAGAKNLLDSYSYGFTGNQTIDEQKANLMRIHIEKFRNYKLPNKPIKIATNYDLGRFYDHSRTKKLYYNNEEGKYIF